MHVLPVRVNNFLNSQVSNLRARGMEFLTIPDSYYDELQKNLSKSRTVVAEDMELLKVAMS